jgi:hypothetical protein
MRLPISSRTLLNALDGIVYLVDGLGILRAYGDPNWTVFADAQNAPHLGNGAAIGKSIFDGIEGEEVRTAYRRLHGAAASSRGRRITFEYRCDSPATERTMRMSLTNVIGSLVLYQSQILSEVPRPWMSLFNFKNSYSARGRNSPVVTMCSFCNQVRWPLSASDEEVHWISPGDYYRSGGQDDVSISHGICPRCTKVIVETFSFPE